MIEVGTDIVSVKRIRKSLDSQGERFEKRVFSDWEIQFCREYSDFAVRFAGRFAAKEAVIKILKDENPDVSMKEVEIRVTKTGRPEVLFLGKKTEIAVSISHCEEYATATAVREK
ncbi:holo-ACP synthase [bacterium]|nr:holo-ACP synthase [bacterium]MBL7052869.1 holo-ACP synthase [Candidatus Neomarinimicrobiota bacterium]